MSTKPNTPPGTEIAFMLDRSGSMLSPLKAAVTPFSSFVGFLREPRQIEVVPAMRSRSTNCQ